MKLSLNRPALLLFSVLAGASLFVVYVHLQDATSKDHLLERLKQLQELNGRLHRDIGLLSDMAERSELLKRKASGETAPLQDSGSDSAAERKSSLNEDNCETIHIAMVAAGVKAARNVTTVLKSIAFYRHNPLHFHILTDAAGLHILTTVFQTWQLPAVNVSFYSTEPLIEKVQWIPNSHYSGVFGLLKLTLPSVLPDSLYEVIVLDTDILVTSDIAYLAKFFDDMRRQKKLLGLVENLSDWYFGNLWEKHRPWPALGRGFNSGVVLLNLRAMREAEWERMWTSVARETLKTHLTTSLADQDIVNAVIKENLEIHYIVPCAWNVQLSEHTLSDYCVDISSHFKLIHWNSPQRLEVQKNYGPYFKNLYHSFQNLDGEMLKESLLRCDSSEEKLGVAEELEFSEKREAPCSEFRNEREKIRRTHPFILDSSAAAPAADPYDVTLVAQLSLDRLHMLEPLCKHWKGPLSISLYATDSELQEVLQYFSRSEFFKDYLKSSKLALHVVYKSGHHYPVNYLRNVALRNAQTPYVFLSDIDFLPMYGLYHYLKEAIKVLGTERRAFVVPAFETLLYRFTFPQGKDELLRMLDAGDVYTFRYHVWKEGHAPTNYEHWKTAVAPYKVDWAANFEPYVVVSRNVTEYDERFVGFGWNKVSHIMELDAQGYDFVVLHGAFMIHMPHAPSLDIAGFRSDRHYRDCVEVLKREFQRELLAKYGSRARKYLSGT